MITLNGTEYKLVLIDTNILSEVIKNKFQERSQLLTWTASHKSILCISPFTILEIRNIPTIYEQFLELFSTIPFIILKSHEQLLQNEVSVYPISENVNPVLIGFAGILSKAKPREVLEKAFNDKQILADEKYWNMGREQIVKGIKELVKNYPPENGKYTKKKIRDFVQLAGFQQIALRQSEFARSVINSGGIVEVDAFPSIKMTSLVVFHKFYVDARKPSISDAFDIIIFAAVPYVDIVIGENHFVAMLKKIKSQDSFINHVTAFNMKYLRSLK